MASAKRLTDHEVERLAGQTPCLCGSIESWHAKCYRGKTDEQLKAGYILAFKKARRTLRQREKATGAKNVPQQLRAAIALATKETT